MNIVPLPTRHDCHDVAKALRHIADDIEAGNYDFEPTMAVVVIGMQSERITTDGTTLAFNWQTHGLGDCGYFAAKGLLASAIASFEGTD